MTAIWSATSGAAGGTPVVLVHGSLDRSAGLLRLSRRLSDRCRVTRYDRRGYGRSAPHAGPFDMPAQVDDLVAVIDEHVAGPAVVIGHSYGGNVALACAERRPGLVRAVVAYESPLSWEPWWPQMSGSRQAISGELDPADAAERFLRSLIGDDRWDRLPPGTRAARQGEGAALVAELADLRRAPPWDAGAITTPVLSLYGECGRDYHRRGAEELAERIEGAEVAEVAEARHFGPNTHPDAVVSVVLDFLDRIGVG